MRKNLVAILAGIAMFSAETSKSTRIMCVPNGNKQKVKQKAKPKNRASSKYKSTKPVQAKAVKQFRNKSNI